MTHLSFVLVMRTLMSSPQKPDFRARHTHCMQRCQLNCGVAQCNDRDEACKARKKKTNLCIEPDIAFPWDKPDLNKDNFGSKWCKAKYEMMILATSPDQDFFPAVPYPLTREKSGEFVQEDHRSWLSPTCSTCVDDEPFDEVPDVHARWMKGDGAQCRTKTIPEGCTDDCTQFCEKACDCAWGPDAISGYDVGRLYRWRRGGRGIELRCMVSKFERKCHCEDGVAAPSGLCPKHGAHFCISCDKWLFLSDDGYCENLQCECTNGIGADGTLCRRENGDRMQCESCYNGYHLSEDGRECHKNMCRCQFGTAEVECDEHMERKCASCDASFYKPEDAQVCRANECICIDGIAARGLSCTENNTHICDACNSGFQLMKDRKCKGKMCTCPNGIHTRGHDCPRDGFPSCYSCHATYHIEEEICYPNVCTCNNGSPVPRKECELHESYKCGECHIGYHLLNDNCHQNKCHCDNGVETTGRKCHAHNLHICESCDVGFYVNEEVQCEKTKLSVSGLEHKISYSQNWRSWSMSIANLCSCPAHGEPVVGTKCIEHGLERCAECEIGYHVDPDSQLCEENTCTCFNGTAVTGKECREHNGHICAYCKDDHQFENERCHGVCDGAVLYKDCYYSVEYPKLETGDYTANELRKLGVQISQLSALKIPKGCLVKVKNNYKFEYFTSNEPCFYHHYRFLNDKVTGISIRGLVEKLPCWGNDWGTCDEALECRRLDGTKCETIQTATKDCQCRLKLYEGETCSGNFYDMCSNNLVCRTDELSEEAMTKCDDSSAGEDCKCQKKHEIEYGIGYNDKEDCPDGFNPMLREECSQYAKKEGKDFKNIGRDPNNTPGCFLAIFENGKVGVKFNDVKVGKSQSSTLVVCLTTYESEYEIGYNESEVCPDGFNPMFREEECRRYATKEGNNFKPIGRDPNNTPGCFLAIFENGKVGVKFNDVKVGKSKSNTLMVCLNYCRWGECGEYCENYEYEIGDESGRCAVFWWKRRCCRQDGRDVPR